MRVGSRTLRDALVRSTDFVQFSRNGRVGFQASLPTAPDNPDKGTPAARRVRKARGLSEITQPPKEMPCSFLSFASNVRLGSF